MTHTSSSSEVKAPQLEQFLPFVSQVLTLTGVVFPTAVSPKLKHSQDFQMLVEMGKSDSTAVSPFQKAPDADQTLEQMQGLGKKMQALVGYNPVGMMEDLLGKEGLREVVSNVTKFANEFPDTVTESQVQDAEMVLLTMGVYGAESTAAENATSRFMNGMNPAQTKLIFDLQHHVLERLMDVMVNPDGTPTEALVKETEKQLEALESSPMAHITSALVNTAFILDEPKHSLFELL
jgi:hypothetical protein